MDSRFFEAFCARDCVRVLGRRLRPFSIWHAAVLELMGSPFVGAERECSLQELVLAVEVCAMEPEGDQLRVPVPPSRRRWLARVLFYFRLWRWGRRYLVELVRFRTYVAEASVGPQYYDSTGNLKTPWPVYLAARLVAHGEPRREAWAMSPGRAKWWSAALCEATGGDPNVVSEADRKAMKEAGYNV